jgi:hypothetical protein
MSAQSSSATRRSTTAAETNMSLDRPGLDELVPSRYALEVGAIDVMVISDGVVTPPAESMATNADPASGPPGWTACSCRGTRSIGR